MGRMLKSHSTHPKCDSTARSERSCVYRFMSRAILRHRSMLLSSRPLALLLVPLFEFSRTPCPFWDEGAELDARIQSVLPKVFASSGLKKKSSRLSCEFWSWVASSASSIYFVFLPNKPKNPATIHSPCTYSFWARSLTHSRFRPRQALGIARSRRAIQVGTITLETGLMLRKSDSRFIRYISKSYKKRAQGK